MRKRFREIIGSNYFHEFLAETIGTMILLLFGFGSIAQTVTGRGKFGGILSINFGWAVGVMFGIFVSGGVSGGHLNPAVTLAMVVTKRLPWKKLPIYWLGQSIGAFVASAIVYGVYYDLLKEYEKQVGNTSGKPSIDLAWIWATRPYPGVSTATAFADQFVSSALLVGIIFALTDKRNSGPSPQLLPLCVALIVLGIGISFGINCGYGINPARNLLPRIFTSIAGWGTEPFTYQHYYFWAPILAQLLGGIMGGLTYLVTIEMHHKEKHHQNNEKEDPTISLKVRKLTFPSHSG